MRATDGSVGIGDTLADRYEIGPELGRGGMGRVFQAHDGLLGRDVALKILTTIDDDETSREACLREARIAARVSHPNIAAVLDVGVDVERNLTFLVMELVPGQTLKELRRAAGSLAPARAVALVSQVAHALEATHARGVVHGDVTPKNVIVRGDGIAKLVDFGIARVQQATRPIEARGLYGSVPYLAPEQVRGSQPDARSDVYALGAVLYELLVGEPPFAGGDAATQMAARLVVDPRLPSERNPSVTPALDRVVMTALARDPLRRYAHAGELRGALSLLVDEASIDTEVFDARDASGQDGSATARIAPVHESSPGSSVGILTRGLQRATPRIAHLARGAATGGVVALGALGGRVARGWKRGQAAPGAGRATVAVAALTMVVGLALIGAALSRSGNEDAKTEAPAATAWATLTRQTCEWSNVTTPPAICFGERPAGFRVQIVERAGPRTKIWDPTTNGVAYVDADALKPE